MVLHIHNTEYVVSLPEHDEEKEEEDEENLCCSDLWVNRKFPGHVPEHKDSGLGRAETP